MSLISLIKDQTIQIDDHNWGNKEIKSFEGENKDVHLDKRTNFPMDGKLQHVVIKISLNSNKGTVVHIIKNKNKKLDKIPQRLEKEIKNALSDINILKRFFWDIANVINNYESKLDNREKCIEVFDRVAKNFGLKFSGEDIFKLDECFEATYKHPQNNKEYKMKLTGKSLKIGEKSGYYKDFFNSES
ncbi:hypothetical protein [Acinetobacter johnsonii]|uniref:hypothetical protein n=1 Tax=Acinetobacter johnsonii TaxID=40214 RepID=UPI00133053E5|nr:hypothetical protein [Acinetobacter johnsonii]